MQQRDRDCDDDAAPQIADSVLGTMIGYRLKRAYMKIQPHAARTLAEDGLRVVSFSCLSIITDNPGIVQSELAAALRIERSNLVVVIDELEQAGLITRKRVPTDRRRYALTATLRGRHLRDRAARRARKAEDAILSRLTPQEQDFLRATLKRLEASQDD